MYIVAVGSLICTANKTLFLSGKPLKQKCLNHSLNFTLTGWTRQLIRIYLVSVFHYRSSFNFYWNYPWKQAGFFTFFGWLKASAEGQRLPLINGEKNALLVSRPSRLVGLLLYVRFALAFACQKNANRLFCTLTELHPVNHSRVAL